jgi:hypothetical protein
MSFISFSNIIHIAFFIESDPMSSSGPVLPLHNPSALVQSIPCCSCSGT